MPDAAAFRAALGPVFTIEDRGPGTPEGVEALERALRDEGGVGLVDSTGLARLIPPAEARRAAMRDLPGELEEIPSAWFDAMAEPALATAGLGDLDVSYRADATTVAALVGKGAVDAAILLPPVTVEQIRAAALAGIRMPQKTTYFAPKPLSGLVYRPLDD
jgi:hypothetical protein